MCRYHICHVASLAELRAQTEHWDDLWMRSPVTHVTARAALVEAWVDAFSDPGRFRAVTVWDRERMVAALPLLTRRKARFLKCLDLPGNEWASAGQLLLDPAGDVPAVCDTLVEALLQLRCAAFWCASVPLHAACWRALIAALGRAGCDLDARTRYHVGLLRLSDPSTASETVGSEGLRRRMRKALRHLAHAGTLQLHVEQPSSAADALELLKRGLQLEHSGWKGRDGTSVLAHPPAERYLRQQARHLADWGQLHLAALSDRQQWIAFEYGWVAKRVYHSYKVAYDERYRRYSPGQLLVHQLLQRWRSSGTVDQVDFLGPLDDAVQRWCPDRYVMGRLLFAPRGLVGRSVLIASRYAGCR
jgi:CelD/BcsL family acetyltransferase involved in cellulose biosynthesis